MRKLSTLLLILPIFSYAQDAYVKTDTTSEYLSPSKSAKITNTLRIGQKVEILEIKNGFARVSPFYSGEVEGISGNVARWVPINDLSSTNEKPNIETNTELEKAIANSDDFHLYKDKFVAHSQALITKGKCSIADFKEMGGWLKSTSGGKSIYFTYCGGFSLQNKVYIDISKKP
ncbi:hypothetical protein NYR78_06720 [Actinobacillus equuli subsp. haemolyticus]|uniref:hypothetical protein n=1 Tax=Actinobacillus equuli TaxID=718 RepID=UPI0024183C9B|nr:hypothetical protein [Actinobacillus equuli]MDG4952785.1 hypothetical protein [Actinobacillus equuli subsp. equuli]WGE68677.1 hypothetical protein NYR78_06720 [Actinobacillus equuli subsp. haemolyticus]WGE80612.1 hypothetical protein NYR66_06595 [Actinobacillus equuli subsp. haemolyticus]